MGFLVDYTGGIDVTDYKLHDCGDGNGFTIHSEHCEIMNHFDVTAHKGLIQLTTETLTRGVITLGDAERVVITVEEAQDLITCLQDAIEDAEPEQWKLREQNEQKQVSTANS